MSSACSTETELGRMMICGASSYSRGASTHPNKSNESSRISSRRFSVHSIPKPKPCCGSPRRRCRCRIPKNLCARNSPTHASGQRASARQSKHEPEGRHALSGHVRRERCSRLRRWPTGSTTQRTLYIKWQKTARFQGARRFQQAGKKRNPTAPTQRFSNAGARLPIVASKGKGV